MNGHQFRRAQRDEPGLAATPVIAISGADHVGHTIDADAFVAKPFTAELLAQVIERVLHRACAPQCGPDAPAILATPGDHRES